jgi:hypothetical protein
MLLIDQNISEMEVWRLREWRIAVRVIGEEIAEKSINDENLLPVLHRLKRPTFFTKDRLNGTRSASRSDIGRPSAWVFSSALWRVVLLRVTDLVTVSRLVREPFQRNENATISFRALRPQTERQRM